MKLAPSHGFASNDRRVSGMIRQRISAPNRLTPLDLGVVKVANSSTHTNGQKGVGRRTI